jgi:HPt (histidine-containing phosphotransfer) domain-containing protein
MQKDLENDRSYKGRNKDCMSQPFLIEDALERVADDKEFLITLVEEFFIEVPSRLRKLDEAVKEGNRKAIVTHSHSLSGILCNIGAVASSDVASQIEHNAPHKELDDVASMCVQLEAELLAFRREFERFKNS